MEFNQKVVNQYLHEKRETVSRKHSFFGILLSTIESEDLSWPDQNFIFGYFDIECWTLDFQPSKMKLISEIIWIISERTNSSSMLRSNKTGWTGDDLSWWRSTCYNEETSPHDCSLMWLSLTMSLDVDIQSTCDNFSSHGVAVNVVTLFMEKLWELEFIPRKKKSSKTESEESKRHSNSIIAIL